MRRWAWLWALALAVLAVAGGLRLRGGRAVQTDLLAMLPDTERNPVAEAGIRVLAQATGDRAIFLVGAGTAEAGRAGALAFAHALDHGAFARVTGQLPPMDPGMVARFYAPYRFRLPQAAGARAADPEQRLAARDVTFDPLADADDEDGSYSPASYLPAPDADPAIAVERAEWEDASTVRLKHALATLDDRSRAIVERRWLRDEDKATLHELAAEYSVSAERIRQIEANALKKLKAAMV